MHFPLKNGEMIEILYDNGICSGYWYSKFSPNNKLIALNSRLDKNRNGYLTILSLKYENLVLTTNIKLNRSDYYDWVDDYTIHYVNNNKYYKFNLLSKCANEISSFNIKNIYPQPHANNLSIYNIDKKYKVNVYKIVNQNNNGIIIENKKNKKERKFIAAENLLDISKKYILLEQGPQLYLLRYNRY